MQYSFSKFFSMLCSLLVVSSKEEREREKKKVLGQLCDWLSEAVAHLPSAVILLLLQISGMSLTLASPLRLFYLEKLGNLSPFQAHGGRWHCTCSLRSACLFIVHMRSGLSCLSCEVFLPPLFPEASMLLAAKRVLPLLPSPASLFIYSSMRGCPSPLISSQGALPSLLRVFFVVVYYSVSLFFPGWGSVCPGDYADLAQGCLWEYCMPLSSPWGLHLLKSSGCWRLEHGSLSGFSVWRGVGMLCAGWGCGVVKVLPLLSSFSCKVYLQHLSKILL
jgi:hypothetical protein